MESNFRQNFFNVRDLLSIVALLIFLLSGNGFAQTTEVKLIGQQIEVKFTNAQSQSTTNKLVGYGDYGMLAETAFTASTDELATFFNRLRTNKINLVRVWVHYHFAKDLTPFVKEADGKYKLLESNAAFYDRLYNFVQKASENGIVVMLCLFDANQIETSRSRNLRWDSSPYNDKNNSDVGFLKEKIRVSKNENVDSRVAFFTYKASDKLSRNNQRKYDKIYRTLRGIHTRIVNEVVNRVGNFTNIIYEICNEPEYDSKPFRGNTRVWHGRIINQLRKNFESTSGSKLIAVNVHEDDELTDVKLTDVKKRLPRGTNLITYHLKLDFWRKQRYLKSRIEQNNLYGMQPIKKPNNSAVLFYN